jgi:subtilisin family serine protease
MLFGLTALGALSCLPAVRSAPAQPGSKLHPALTGLLDETNDPVRAWVLFADKGITSSKDYAAALEDVAAHYNPRAIQRRRLRRSAPGLFDERDLPVVPAYVDAVEASGARLRVTARWVNAISVVADRGQLEAIAELPFVRQLQPVGRSRGIEPNPAALDDGTPGPRGFYGYAQEQLTQINLIAVHDAGFTGQGVIIGVLDTGFERSHEAFNYPGHELSVLAEWDFVDGDADTSIEPGDYENQHSHGTLILGVLGAYRPNELVGAAYDAAFVLAKTEDLTGEYPAEEDYYVAGLQFIESNGADLATSSLGYIDWYTQGDLDGQTAVTTIAVNTATANGLVCCTAAGNAGHDGSPDTSHLIAPSDAFQVITCGAVESTGESAGFSSDGPTADGRVKPEVLAQGVNTVSVWPYGTTDYTYASGTSLSTPLIAGATACLLQAHPEWTVDQTRGQLFHTSDYYVASRTYDPLYIRGYGVIDAHAALIFTDCNGNGIDDAEDISGGTSDDCNENGIPDECDITDGTSADINGNGIPDECECLGDLDGDSDIDLADLAGLLAHLGTVSGATYEDGDIDSDHDVDLSDLAALLAAYGTSCE